MHAKFVKELERAFFSKRKEGKKMRYEKKGTYDFEAMGWNEYKEFDKDFERTDEYDDAIWGLFKDNMPTDEEIDAVARRFNVPFDYVEDEGWGFVEA